MFTIPPLCLHVNYHVQEPYVSHMGINVYVHCPLYLPKKVSKKPSVNHIGSSMSQQQALKNFQNVPDTPTLMVTVKCNVKPFEQ